MTSHSDRSLARVALSRLPGWVTVLGMALVLAELAAATVPLVTGRGGLAAGPHGGTGRSAGMRTVVLDIANAHRDDSATYTTPTGDGRFTMPAETRPLIPGAIVAKTVGVQAGGIVTIHVVPGTGGTAGLTCTIMVNGGAVSQATAEYGGFRSWATCRARVP